MSQCFDAALASTTPGMVNLRPGNLRPAHYLLDGGHCTVRLGPAAGSAGFKTSHRCSRMSYAARVAYLNVDDPLLVSRPNIMPVACRQREEGSGLEKRTGPVSILPEAESDAAGDDRHGFGVNEAVRGRGREFHGHHVPIACRCQDSKLRAWPKVADMPPFQISRCHDRRCLDVLLRRKRSGAAAGRFGFRPTGPIISPLGTGESVMRNRQHPRAFYTE
jgi:hypothetical protein